MKVVDSRLVLVGNGTAAVLPPDLSLFVSKRKADIIFLGSFHLCLWRAIDWICFTLLYAYVLFLSFQLRVNVVQINFRLYLARS